MKKTIYLIASLVVIIAVGTYAWMQKTTVEEPHGKLVSGSDQETFSGLITAVDTSCFFDAVCSVSVDGKKVILVTGRMAATTTPPMGRLIGAESIGELEDRIGDHANVYATTTPEGDYTIYGSTDYYVEVVKMDN